MRIDSIMDKTEVIMNTIKWVNDTFVPKGLKPIEDLPRAQPGQGEACVLAKILRTHPRWPSATVSSSYVHLNIDGIDYGSAEQDIDMPEEVRMFIADFDRGEYPDLIEEVYIP